MDGIGLEVTLILLLVLANGLFSMAEMAVVSSRKARLQQRADNGSRGARIALELAEHPHDFLSTVQVGITMVGTLAGAFGGATIAEKLAVYLQQYPAVAPYRDTVSISIVVLAISYLTLILGELVPKSLALSHAETIASAVGPAMKWLAKVGSPAVRFLSLSTRVVMKILPVKHGKEAPVTEEEIRVLIEQGTEFGTFRETEQDMVEGVFRLGDRRVAELMRPRGKVISLDVDDPWQMNLSIIRDHPHSRFPVIAGDLDRLIGTVHVKDILLARDRDNVDLRALVKPPEIVPDSAMALGLLERFMKTGGEMAFVVDEHGGVQGLITFTDLMEAVVGDIERPGEESAPKAIPREDGSWLVDGLLSISDLLDALELRRVPGEVEEGFTTVGGLILAHLKRMPEAGDHCLIGDWRFEILDMDGNRIDKVLVNKPSQ